MLRTHLLLPALLFYTCLVDVPVRCEWSSSERAPCPAPAPVPAPLYPPLQHETQPYDTDLEAILPRTDLQNAPQQESSHSDLESEFFTNDLKSNLEQKYTNLEPKESEPYHIDLESILQDNTPLNRQLEARDSEFYNDGLESNLTKVRSPDASVQDESEPYVNDIESNLEGRPTEARNVETDNETNVQRDKRSSGQEWDKTSKSSSDSRRVKTGDTILNIRGAVRDAIGDAGAAPGPRTPGPRASSRLDTFVIRGAAARSRTNHAPYKPPPRDQVPRHARELLVAAHARASIPCDLHNVTNIRWYKDNELVVLASTPGEGAWREGGAAVVGRATRSDAGAWRCAAGESSGTPVHLLIYEAVRSVYLAVDGRRLDAGNTWVPVRDNTELDVTCVAEGGVPPPEVSWRLLATEPALDHRPYLRIHSTNYSIEGVSTSSAVITAARELHNATLQCQTKQRRPDTPPTSTPPHSTAEEAYEVLTAKLEIHVTYPPSFVISRWPGFGVSLAAGGAAALRCDVDANPPARAWWLRDDENNPTSSPPPLESGLESRGSATLRWAALQDAHAGWYRCRASWLDAEYSSIGYYLNIISAEDQTEPATEASTAEEELEPEHQKVDVTVGGNVQLHCPKGSVGCWWRKVVGNSSDAWAPAGSHHAHGVLGIKDAVYQEGGEYRCVGARGSGRDAARLRELKRVTVRVSGGATAAALSAQPARPGSGGGWRLECGACGRGVRVVWLRARRPPEPAALAPDLAQHCWRAVLHVHDPDEVWCVAATAGGAAVAVFPPRAPHPSPAPARHTVRAPYNAAVTSHAHTLTLALSLYMLAVV